MSAAGSNAVCTCLRRVNSIASSCAQQWGGYGSWTENLRWVTTEAMTLRISVGVHIADVNEYLHTPEHNNVVGGCRSKRVLGGEIVMEEITDRQGFLRITREEAVWQSTAHLGCNVETSDLYVMGIHLRGCRKAFTMNNNNLPSVVACRTHFLF